MAPESKQSFLFTGVRAHARLQFRLRHPPRFIVPQLIRLSYRRNTAPPLRSIKFANRPGEIRRDTPVPTNYRPNEIDTLEIRSLVKTEREKKKREFSFDDENDFVHLARSNKYSLFFLFFFSKQTGSKIDYQVYRFEDSFRKRRGRSDREKEGGRREEGRVMQPRFDFESEIIVPDASHFLVEERERERTCWYSRDFHTGSSVTRNHQSFPLSLSYWLPPL